MMGIGTPTAWQVNVTVDPRAAWTDSSGGLVTEGGAVKDNGRIFQHKHRTAVFMGEFGDAGKSRKASEEQGET